MSDESAVLDGYESYYTEKLWQLVPEVYRNEDGLAAHPGVLRRLVELIAAEAAESRRSIDRLWEDQHVETCDDWAVPYIGDLVGARLVSALDRRGRRVDVASAVRFRRRRGTPDLLDHLVRAMSGWDVVLVEGFRRLARTRHRLDPAPRAGGFFTRTFAGGTADLRDPAGAELADGPFGEYFHTPDARLLRGRDGRFGVTKLNFHIFRLRAYELTGVDPVELTDPGGEGFPRRYTVDPSGRDVPLFIDADPPDPDEVSALPGQLSRPTCGQPREWEVTQAMRCRLLGHDAYLITPSIFEELQQLPNPPNNAAQTALSQLFGVRFESEPAMRRRLRDLGAGIPNVLPVWYRELVALALVEDTGKARLYPSQIEISSGGDSFPRVRISSANLGDRECQPDPEGSLATLLISPAQGRFATSPPDAPDFDPLVERYHYGFSGDVGAGPYARDPVPAADVPTRTAANGVVPDGGVLQGDGLRLDDNRTYTLSVLANTPVDARAVLQAGPQRRPYVTLDGGAANLTPDVIDSTFLIDGGWYGVNDPDLADEDVVDFRIEGAAGAGPEDYDFQRVEIRFATLDPGGLRADGVRLPPVRLLVRARVRRLVIRRSIVGPVHVVRENPDDPSMVEELLICESVVDARETAGRLAVSSSFGTVVIEGSTIFGDVHADVLRASDTIVDGRVRVVNNQAGCFRFSASEPGAGVRLPPRYRDLLAPIPEAAFNSTRFGDPQYAQLSVVAPPQLARGAENGSEMGVFSHLLAPIRLSSVRAKVGEFGPVGMLAQYLFEGDYRAESLVRFGLLSPAPGEVEAPPPPDPGELIPEPEPPEPEPLPVTCGDEDDGVVTILPPPAAPRVEIDLGAADLNGAPDFWRGLDWREELFPAPAEGRRPRGIPFDRVRVLLEYDARFGTMPAEQGWRASGDEVRDFYELDGRRALRFKIEARPAFFTAEAVLAEWPPAQLHAYVNVALDEAPEALRESAEGFTQLVEANLAGKPFHGLRADWSKGRGRGDLHYLTLDGRAVVGSPVPPRRRAAEWRKLSMQAGFFHDAGRRGWLPKLRPGRDGDAERLKELAELWDKHAGRALVSLDEQVEEFKLKDFGETQGGFERATLRAVFGLTRKGARAAGSLRNFVASAPGRYIRAWMRAESPSRSPVLELGFAAQEAARAGARFRVRYGRERAGETALPLRIAEATLKLDGEKASLHVPLRAVRARDPLVITLERDSLHPDDTLEASVRLVSAALVGDAGR